MPLDKCLIICRNGWKIVNRLITLLNIPDTALLVCSRTWLVNNANNSNSMHRIEKIKA